MQTIFFFKTVVQTIFFLIFLPADNFFYQIRYPPVRKIMVRPLTESLTLEMALNETSFSYCMNKMKRYLSFIGNILCFGCMEFKILFDFHKKVKTPSCYFEKNLNTPLSFTLKKVFAPLHSAPAPLYSKFFKPPY